MVDQPAVALGVRWRQHSLELIRVTAPARYRAPNSTGFSPAASRWWDDLVFSSLNWPRAAEKRRNKGVAQLGDGTIVGVLQCSSGQSAGWGCFRGGPTVLLDPTARHGQLRSGLASSVACEENGGAVWSSRGGSPREFYRGRVLHVAQGLLHRFSLQFAPWIDNSVRIWQMG
jgi:hypothetical protein